MCNRARVTWEIDRVREEFGAKWIPNRSLERDDATEMVPTRQSWVMRQDDRGRSLDIMTWDVLGGGAAYPMTNVRQLGLPQWRRLASDPTKRCLIPVTEFAEWSDQKYKLGDGKPPIKGETWFRVTDQDLFAIAGFWQDIAGEKYYAMVTCDANELVKPIHPKAMVTILHRDDHERWLTGGYDDALALQIPYPADRMAARGPIFPTRDVATNEAAQLQTDADIAGHARRLLKKYEAAARDHVAGQLAGLSEASDGALAGFWNAVDRQIQEISAERELTK